MSSSEQKSRPGLVLGLLLLVVGSISACNRKTDDENYGKLDLPVNSNAADSGFGDRFEKSLQADENSEPMNVAEGDLPPVDPTMEPVDVR